MREVNKRIEQTHYPLPTLKDIFERWRKYKYFTKSTSPCSIIPSFLMTNLLPPVPFFSQKLNFSLRTFSTIKKELLSGVKLLKEYCSFLKGVKIRIHADYNNLTFKNRHSGCLHNWQTNIEEFALILFASPTKSKVPPTFILTS
jgi:hypothetical protein